MIFLFPLNKWIFTASGDRFSHMSVLGMETSKKLNGGIYMSRIWTTMQDKLILEKVQEYKEKGLPAARAHEDVAKALNCHHTHVAARYNRIRQQQQPEQPKMENVSSVSALLEGLQEIIEENTRLKQRVQQLEDELSQIDNMKTEYSMMLHMIEQARKAAFAPVGHSQFKMDRNGNLERVSSLKQEAN